MANNVALSFGGEEIREQVLRTTIRYASISKRWENGDGKEYVCVSIRLWSSDKLKHLP